MDTSGRGWSDPSLPHADLSHLTAPVQPGAAGEKGPTLESLTQTPAFSLEKLGNSSHTANTFPTGGQDPSAPEAIVP